jgi:plasmid maintenance system killer protein
MINVIRKSKLDGGPPLIIYYSSNKLKKHCETEALGNKAFGPKQAEKIRQRIKEFEAAPSLHDISRLPPPRCHELKGSRRGCLAVVLADNMRLIFKPNHDSVPLLSAGGLDWRAVTSIIILEVTDYHGD